MRENPRIPVSDLKRDPSDRPGDHGLGFPQGLRDRKSKPFFEGFLDDNRGGPLNRVDFDMAGGRKKQDNNIRVLAGRLLGLGQNLGSLGVIIRSASDQEKA